MTAVLEQLGNRPHYEANLTYIRRVDAAGGWKKYEQSHRTRLTTTFARVVFPRLPIAAISNIVCSWAHVGFY